LLHGQTSAWGEIGGARSNFRFPFPGQLPLAERGRVGCCACFPSSFEKDAEKLGARVCVCGIEIEIVDFGAGLLTTYYLCGGTWVYLFLFLFLFLFFYRLRKRVARLWVVERV